MRLWRESPTFRKFLGVILGANCGFWAGIIVGTFIVSFWLNVVLGEDISGENYLGVALLAFIFGAPVGVLVGAIIGFMKRENKKWLWFFFFPALLTLFYGLVYFFG